ncbi:hypothetical protein evm_007975 [Chilo suppressalis]|nr:hypothetical protein evm_007975 [Chilo suppressalis]
MCVGVKERKSEKELLHCLFLNRVDEEELDDLSCTDLEQQWGSIKATHYKTYEAKRLCDLCHVKCQSRSTVQVTEVMKARWREILLQSAPLSEYSLFYSGVRMSYTTCSDEDANNGKAEVSRCN